MLKAWTEHAKRVVEGRGRKIKGGCMMIQGNEFFTKMEMSVFTEKYSVLTLGL